METFVRESFYIQPPTQAATVEEWTEWVKADDRKAAAHKASYTRAANLLAEEEGTVEIPESTSMMKVGGVWRQSTSMGFVGDAEQGTCAIEPIIEAAQEKICILRAMEETRNIRGGTKAGKSSRRRKNRKNKK